MYYRCLCLNPNVNYEKHLLVIHVYVLLFCQNLVFFSWNSLIIFVRSIIICVILLFVCFSLWFLSELFLFSLQLDSFFLVERLSSVLSFFFCVLDCWISTSRSLVTLLVLVISSLLDVFFVFFGLGWLFKGVVSPDDKTYWYFYVVTIVLLSDPLLLLSSVDS